MGFLSTDIAATQPTTLSYRGTRKLWLVTSNPPPLSATRSKEKFLTASRQERQVGIAQEGPLRTQWVPPKTQCGGRSEGVQALHLVLTGNSACLLC